MPLRLPHFRRLLSACLVLYCLLNGLLQVAVVAWPGAAAGAAGGWSPAMSQTAGQTAGQATARPPCSCTCCGERCAMGERCCCNRQAAPTPAGLVLAAPGCPAPGGALLALPSLHFLSYRFLELQPLLLCADAHAEALPRPGDEQASSHWSAPEPPPPRRRG